MKATGEVMSYRTNDRGKPAQSSTFSLEIGVCHLYMPKFDGDIVRRICLHISARARDDRLFAIAELIRRGVRTSELYAT